MVYGYGGIQATRHNKDHQFSTSGVGVAFFRVITTAGCVDRWRHKGETPRFPYTAIILVRASKHELFSLTDVKIKE